MGAITTLLDAGNDAFSSLYDVQIDFPSVLNYSVSNDVTKVRIQNFTPPTLDFNTYKSYYKTVTIDRPSPDFVGEKMLTIPIRTDSAYNIYDAMLRWKNLYANPNGETNINFPMYESILRDNYVGKITVFAYNAVDSSSIQNPEDSSVAKTWKFFDVFCSKVTSPAFTRQTPTPVEFTATFYFSRMISSESDITNSTDTPSNP
jgi:hypothetical protein